MKYPDQYATTAKSESIRVGDLVWWNEGVYVGYIVEVLEQNEQYEVWGLDEPGVVLTNLHPFEANKRKRQRCPGFIATGGTVVYPAKSLEDEGVGLLSSHERAEMDWAVATAQSKLARGLSHLDFCVSAVMNAGSDGEDWRIDFVDEDRQVIETFVVPFRPDTREKEVKRIQTNQSTLLTDMLGTLDMDVFGSTDPRKMPKHLFGSATHLEYASAIRGDIEKQNFSVCPRHWYVEADFKCAECGQEFTWTVDEQRVWFEEHYLWIDARPRHCKNCKSTQKRLKNLRKEYDLIVAAAQRRGRPDLKKRIIEIVTELELRLENLPDGLRETKQIFERQLRNLTEKGDPEDTGTPKA
jgi:hypothetical protein